MDTAVKESAPLAARNVSVRIGARELVNNLTVDFSTGEFVAVLGRNGCGGGVCIQAAVSATAMMATEKAARCIAQPAWLTGSKAARLMVEKYLRGAYRPGGASTSRLPPFPRATNCSKRGALTLRG